MANRNSSPRVIEGLNRHWADLANHYADKNGKPADYDHRSYERLGIDKKPTPKVPLAWVKRPRRAPHTYSPPRARRGSPLTTTVLPARQTPSVELGMVRVLERITQQRQARGTSNAFEQRRVSREAARSNRVPSTAGPELARAKVVAGRTVVLDKHLGLAELMRGAGPMPKDDAARAALERHMLLADFIESLLFAVERGRQEHGDFVMRLQREQIALADSRHRRAMMEQELRDADEALERWLRKHPLRARLRLSSREHGVLDDHRGRIADLASVAHRTVQAHKKTAARLTVDREGRRNQDAEVRRRILACMADYKPDFRDVLAALRKHLTAEQVGVVEQAGDELGIASENLEHVIDAVRSERAFDDVVQAQRAMPGPPAARH